MPDVREIVVDGAILGCSGCMDSMMRKSGPGLNVVSQSHIRIGSRLIATDQDIGTAAIPPFPHCDKLGECVPEVTVEWIETIGNANFQQLVHGESITFCDTGNGIIGTMTSGQNPGAENLSREEEIERVLAFLMLMNEWGIEMGGWTVGELSEERLRLIAADYVDVMRAFDSLRNENGLINFFDLESDPDALDAFYRLTGNSPGVGDMRVMNSWENFLVRTNQGDSQFPLIDGGNILALAVDRAVPNSALKTLLICGIVLGTFVAGITAPMWGPKAIGAVTTGATSAPIATQSLIQQFKKGMITAQQFVARASEMGGKVWKQIKGLFGHKKARFPEGEAQLRHIFADRAGHLIDTPANRQLLLNVANRISNFQGIDQYGNRVYAKILENGSQIWVYVRNGVIQNGGLNLPGAVRTW